MKKIIDYLKELVVSALIAFGLFLVISQFFVIANISGESMAETYHDGQRVFLQKRFNTQKIGDVVAFKFSQDQKDYFNNLDDANSMANYPLDELHVKRVMGLSGDTIKIENNVTYINDEKVSESQISLTDQQYVLGENEIFMLGDNVNNSFDSRQHGPIVFDDIFGEVMFAKDNGN